MGAKQIVTGSLRAAFGERDRALAEVGESNLLLSISLDPLYNPG